MADLLPTWYTRAVDYLSAARAYFSPPAQPTIGGSGFVGEAAIRAVTPTFPVATSLKAYRTDPWVRACVKAKASDISGLPLYGVRLDGGKQIILGPQAKSPLDRGEPQALRSLRFPGGIQSGGEYRRAAVSDKVLLGWSASRYDGRDLRRIHPAAFFPELDRDGEPVSWAVIRADGTRTPLGLSEVLYVSDYSTGRGFSGFFGDAPVEVLLHTIAAAAAAREMARKQADKGQFDTIATHKSEGRTSPESRERTIATFEDLRRKGASTLHLFGETTVQVVSPTIKDMDFPSIIGGSREEAAAVFGLPLSRIGAIPGAYGANRQEARQYWEDLRTRDAVPFEDAWQIQLIRDEKYRVEHDFSAIDSLQAARTEQLAQGFALVDEFGAEPAEALHYVGLGDAPSGKAPRGIGKGALPAKNEPPVEPLDPKPAKREAIARYLAASAERADRAIASGELDREARGAAEAYRLAGFLESQGVEGQKALEVARETVADQDEFLAQMVARTAEKGQIVEGCGNLAAWSEIGAQQIVRRVDSA